LKHFKEDVREMPAGQECGIGLEGFEDFQTGDTMETYRLEREEI
jgi:translation initiation factor IF-2